MQGRLILSLGLLGLVNAQQQQPAMALEDRDICLVSCGEGWCCVSGQKCIAGPLEGVDTPYGCEDEILGFHTTWGAYRGDGKEWPDRPSTTYTKPSESTNTLPAPVESRYTPTTHPVVIYTPPAPPPRPPAAHSSSTTSIITYPVHEPESYSTVTPSSTSTPPIYIETTYSESSSITTISSYSVSYSNSTASFQETKISDAANSAITTPPSSTPTNNSPQPATTTAVRAAAGQISVGNTVAAAGILASFMGFMML
ncbi:hypothetical protein QBC37DRAFT_435243 [Rhypophila decipiens]|uniref:Uncharacterized protein n=1 Tax=Rhypophila decipiens TaxID=261697 RepID=A0AAN6XT53_9PEZI|nr:hypothetical protein QBC37DRAFT_435243 [Rhypophila decipiens]